MLINTLIPACSPITVSHFRGSLHRAFPPYPPSLNERNNPKRIAHPARPPIVIVSLPRGHLIESASLRNRKPLHQFSRSAN